MPLVTVMLSLKLQSEFGWGGGDAGTKAGNEEIEEETERGPPPRPPNSLLSRPPMNPPA